MTTDFNMTSKLKHFIEDMETRGCKIARSSRKNDLPFDIYYHDWVVVRIGIDKKKREYLEIPVNQLKNLSPFNEPSNSNSLDRSLEFFSEKDKATPRRKAIRTNRHFNNTEDPENNLHDSELEKLTHLLVEVGKCIKQKEITPRFEEIYQTFTTKIYPEEMSPYRLYEEGAFKQLPSNRYERNKEARAKCLERKGYKCSVCDMEFEKRYGSIGKGFIHVHHTKLISKAIGPYEIDPINDLVPVCPNCHVMLHKKDPPYTIQELKSLLR